MRLTGLVTAAMMVLSIASSAQASIAGTFYLSNYTGNQVNLNANQVQVDVEDVGGGNVAFTFYNHVGVASNLAEIYLSDGAYLKGSSPAPIITDSDGASTGVEYSVGGTGTSNVPGGISNFHTTASVYATNADNPAPHHSVNAEGEWVRVQYGLIGSKTVADVITGLTAPTASDPAFRIAIHVTGVAGGGSDTYFLGDPIDGGQGGVPEPATLAIWGLGLGIAGLVKLRRNKLAA